MSLALTRLLEAAVILLWILTWFTGGYLLLVNSFKVRRHEATIFAFGLGLILQVWLANWIGHILEPLPAYWLSVAVVFLAGILQTVLQKNWQLVRKNLYFPLRYWLVFAIVSLIFFMIGRGLAIFDDYQNLPMTSYIATGAIPPKLILNPAVSFDYHYLMLLNAAQWMRVANLFPWTALDLNRALFLGLAVIYAALLGTRLTNNRLAGWLTALFFAFAGGFRWLLLFVPADFLEKISEHITLIGSGLATADTLSAAMLKNWAIEGSGPIPFPFAFGNGYYTIPVFKHDGTGMMGTVLAILLILLFERWKNKPGMLLVGFLLSAIALIDEIWFVFFISGLIIYFVLFYLISKRMPAKGKWLEIFFLALMPIGFVAVQGGVLTGVANHLIGRFFGAVNASSEQYFSFQFLFHWPPAIISAHLGELALTQWAQFLVAFCEAGPFILIYPLFLLWSFKAYRAGRSVFAILCIAITLSALTIFVQYQGSAGVSASKRLTLFNSEMLILFTVPLLWYWLKKRRLQVKILVSGFAVMTMLGGLVYFMISSIAIQKPVLSYFIQLMDASVENIFWNRLETDAMVFDFTPSRSATLFARPLISNSTWYEVLPEFKHLRRNPDPVLLRQAGYTHVYLTRDDYRQLSQRSKYLFEQDCVAIVYEKEDWQGDFRWLLDITACQK